tara:strand:- start:10510 stop:11490 length:981 start_codon:yes stop_codon:yes gene_type:complete
MLIEKKNYKRNVKTGDIIKRQKVSVICDRCGSKWETLYDYRKRKKYKEDLCKKCRSKRNLQKQEPLYKRRWDKRRGKKKIVKCNFCTKIIERFPCQIKNYNFCNCSCRDRYNMQKKYGHLDKNFKLNLNEVSYLAGLLLGDGHARKAGNHTTRFTIAFDAVGHWDWIVKQSVVVFDILGLCWNEEAASSSSTCKRIGFTIPNALLKTYGLLWSGDKYVAQPKPKSFVIKNINFVAGLINSDGYYQLVRGKHPCYTFSNIAKSITDSAKICLDFNIIDYKVYHTDNKINKRTGGLNRAFIKLSIHKRECVKRLEDKCFYKVKGNGKK